MTDIEYEVILHKVADPPFLQLVFRRGGRPVPPDRVLLAPGEMRLEPRPRSSPREQGLVGCLSNKQVSEAKHQKMRE